MKKLFTLVIAIAAVASTASAAWADKVSYCKNYAEQQVYAATHPVASTAIGCGLGAAAASILTNGNGGAIAGGCAVGGGAGLVISLDKQDKIRQASFQECMSSGGGSGGSAAPVTFTTFAPPSPTAVTPLDHSVNLRAGPDTTNAILESVPANSTVNVALCSNTGWCQAQTPTNTGWISKSLLSFN